MAVNRYRQGGRSSGVAVNGGVIISVGVIAKIVPKSPFINVNFDINLR